MLGSNFNSGNSQVKKTSIFDFNIKKKEQRELSINGLKGRGDNYHFNQHNSNNYKDNN
jgi:hypothetical protein